MAFQRALCEIEPNRLVRNSTFRAYIIYTSCIILDALKYDRWIDEVYNK